MVVLISAAMEALSLEHKSCWKLTVTLVRSSMGTLSIFDRFAFNGFARLSAPTSSKGMLRFALSAPDKCPFKRRQGNEQGTDWMLKFLSQEFSVWELKSCASLNRDAESLCSSPFDIAEDRSWAKLRSSMLSLMNCNSYNNRCVALVFDWTTGWLGSIIRSIQPQRNRTPWMWFFGSTRTTSDCVGSTSEVSEVESHTEAFLSFLQGTVRQPDLHKSHIVEPEDFVRYRYSNRPSCSTWNWWSTHHASCMYSHRFNTCDCRIKKKAKLLYVYE